MTTEMKQLLALLLLGCVFAVHGGEKGAKKKDPCTQGLAAMQVFMAYPGCAEPNPYRTLRSLFRTFSSNVTVHNMDNLFTNFCSTAFPRIKQCFESNIQNCSHAQRNTLMRMVRQTGFMCEPNTDRTHHVINHLLAKLTDSDLAKNETCNKQNLSIVHPFCFNQSLEAIGGNAANKIDVIVGLRIEQLVLKIRMFTRKMIECMVSQTRNRLSSCPQWRGNAIRGIQFLVVPPILGGSMPFTTEELDQLFQWQSGDQTQMNVENLEQALLNFFK